MARSRCNCGITVESIAFRREPTTTQTSPPTKVKGFLPEGIYLIEEPENGIHPGAISTIYDSLSSVYSAQVLLASHSPVVLNAAESASVLCFAKNAEGATDTDRERLP